MKALPVLSGRQVAKALTKAGFIVVRRRGSHIRLSKSVAHGTIKLTVPDHKTLKKKTLIRIIKASGLTMDEFKELI